AQGVAIASGAGANAAQNNRLLHWDEQQRIKLLANGDPKKEARLTEAACALAHCADGMPKDSPTYAYFKGLQDAGANLTAEKALLSTQQDGNGAMLFQYTGVDRYFVDPWTQNKTGTRLAGAGQAGVGVLGAMGSVALCTTGIGCAAGAISGTISVDYALAGAKQSITGNAQTPYGEQALQSLGLSPQAAAYTYAALGLTPVAVDAMFMKAASGVSSGVVGSEVRAGANGEGGVAREIATPKTSGGTANAATAPGLKEQLVSQNLANIAAQDARLAKAVNGSGVPNPNFPVGSGTAAEANSLGQIWVGDGARPLNGVPGGLMSADGTRVYRPPTSKNAPIEFNPTGIQANFQMRDPNTGAVISNGHMVIK
ncbi:MAG: hypothetical protein V4528_10490, partial [Pseudomonadota bacterium]